MTESTTHSQPSLPNQQLHDRRAIVILVGLVLSLFGVSVSYDFVNWDDPWYVLNNDLIHTWSWQNLYGICTETVTRNFAPLTIFSYLLDYSIWGTWAGGYHLTNLLLHAGNAILVFLLMRQLTHRHVFSLLVAILFAIHPIQIESVVWISARKGLLSSAFILLSLRYWLNPERTSQDEMKGTLLFVVALMCKALAVVLPAVVFFYDVIVLRKSYREAFLKHFISGLIAIWFILITAMSQQTQLGGVRHHLELSKLEIIALDFWLLWKYIGMLIWPSGLAVLYDPSITGLSWEITCSMMAWLGVVGLLWHSRRACPLLLFGGLTAAVFMAPVLNLFPITTLMNDRYLYLPCIPLFAILLLGAETLFRTIVTRLHWFDLQTDNGKYRAFRIAALASCLMVIAYGSMTAHLLPHWRNDLSLWQRAVQMSPDLPVVRYQYSLALWDSGQHHAAVQVLESTLELERLDSFDRMRFQDRLMQMYLQLDQLQTSSLENSCGAVGGCQ